MERIMRSPYRYLYNVGGVFGLSEINTKAD
jgi:hypothetical protein